MIIVTTRSFETSKPESLESFFVGLIMSLNTDVTALWARAATTLELPHGQQDVPLF